MKRATLVGSVTAFFCLGFATTLLAAEPAAPGTVNQSPSAGKDVAAIKPADKCLNDLRVFDNQMEKEGYWLGGLAMVTDTQWRHTVYMALALVEEPAIRPRGRATSFGLLLPPPTFSPDKANNSHVRTCSPRPAISTKVT